MAFNPLANFQQGQQFFNQQQDRALERFEKLDKKRQEAFFLDARKGRKLLEANDSEGFTKLLRNRFDSLEKLGGDTSDVEHITLTFMSGDFDGTLAQLKQVEDMGVFRGSLPDEELRQAKLDKARSRAGSGQKAFAPITNPVTGELGVPTFDPNTGEAGFQVIEGAPLQLTPEQKRINALSTKRKEAERKTEEGKEYDVYGEP